MVCVRACVCVCVCVCGHVCARVLCMSVHKATLTKYDLIYISSHHKDPNLPWYSEEQCWLHLFNGIKQGTLHNKEQGGKEQEKKRGKEEDRERREEKIQDEPCVNSTRGQTPAVLP